MSWFNLIRLKNSNFQQKLYFLHLNQSLDLCHSIFYQISSTAWLIFPLPCWLIIYLRGMISGSFENPNDGESLEQSKELSEGGRGRMRGHFHTI